MQKEKTDFVNILSFKEDPEYLKSCFNALTSLEQASVKVLHYFKRAMTIKEIRNKLVQDISNGIIYAVLIESKIIKVSEIDRAKLSSKDKKKLFKKFAEISTSPSTKMEEEMFKIRWLNFLPIPSSTMEQRRRFLQELIKQTKDNNLQKKCPDEHIRQLNMLLSHHRIEVPSFSTIETALKNLKELRFVLTRPVISKKIKALYFLNPKVDVIIKKARIIEYP